MITALPRKFFSVQGMLKPGQRVGELPKSKTVYQSFFEVAWPSALESVLVSLVSSVDTMMVGGLGEGAIAAVGITNQPKLILLAAIMSLNVGVTAIVARRKGQEDQEGANRCLRQGIVLSALMALIMGVFGFLFARPLMEFAGATPDYIDDAVAYFRILVFSVFFSALNLTICAAWRGVGKTKIAMRTNLISNCVNLVFNYLLINGIGFFPRLEVRGAAIATALGSLVACLISIRSLLKDGEFLSIKGGRSLWKFDGVTMTRFRQISGSAFIEQVFMRIGFFVYAMIVAKLGTTPYATHLICMNIINLSFAFADGCGIAASSLVGQSLGAKRPDMAIVYGKTGQRIAFSISCALSLVFVFGRYFLVSLFSREPAVIELGSQVMFLIAFITFVQTTQVVISGCLRGAGDTRFVAVSSLISITFIRPILSWVCCFTFGWGLIGAWIGMGLDQTMRMVLNFWRFSGGKWTKIRI